MPSSEIDSAPGRLATRTPEMEPHYDVVVVGSGYGGAVAAARLAQGGLSVCVLERGRELRPGDFPDTLPRALRDLQIDLPSRHLFSPTALYDFRVNPDLNVFVGCGLGGTSLINANVAIQPAADVFRDKRWPSRIRDEAPDGSLHAAFAAARNMLRPERYPCVESPRKLVRLREIAAKIPAQYGSAPLELAPVTVMFPAGDGDHRRRPNHVGVLQQPCNGCGDCVSGCNFGAKSTLLQTYLPVAKAAGASMFTEAKVHTIAPYTERPGARWIVWFDYLGGARRRFRPPAPRLFVTARTVVLAAGALGSTEILLRSRRAVALSTRLGEGFSANGDVLGFAWNARNPANAIGGGARSLHDREAPGPCISGMVRADEFLLQEGVIPGALSPILALGFVLARMWRGTEAERRVSRRARGASLWRIADDYLRGGVSSTQTFLGMVADDDAGQLALSADRLRIRWPGAGRHAAYRTLENALTAATGSPGIDGVYVRSPFGNVTVHPLGGAIMAEDASAGVVDDTGAVFTGDGARTHRGLYVCDAAIIPRALIANPLLTITALAERAAPQILAEATG